VNWLTHAERLAGQVTHPASYWRPIIEAIPRHVFVPCWWAWAGQDQWTLQDGPADQSAWAEAAYADRSLVTQVGPLHADHASAADRPAGRPTSSSTLPGLLIQMYEHGYVRDGQDVLDVGTGSGYGCAVLAARVGDGHVTSVDVDEYLTKAAAERLAAVGLHPQVMAMDATGPVPGSFDRIIATVGVRPVPRSWLTALRPGGRIVTTIADTALILTADKTDDGGAAGRIEWDRAGFMGTRAGADYPPTLTELYASVQDTPGERVSWGRYPVINVHESWEVWSMLSLMAPGIEHHYQTDGERRTAWMLHADGSWARASGLPGESPQVHQGGPRSLWSLLEDIRHAWLCDGSLPLYGARVRIDDAGAIHLRRGSWQHTIAE
jgi:protein-L-isoaspartate O-methyltransferase